MFKSVMMRQNISFIIPCVHEIMNVHQLETLILELLEIIRLECITPRIILFLLFIKCFRFGYNSKNDHMMT